MTEELTNLKRSLREIRRGGDLEIHERVDLRAWTALRVGGIADLVVRCHSIVAVQAAIDLMAAHGSRWLVLGSGSTLVPADLGLRLPALSLSGQLCRWELDEGGVVAGAGANLTQLGRSVAHGALDELTAMPGGKASIGGAIVTARVDRTSKIRDLLDWLEVSRPGVPLDRIEVSTPEDGFDWSAFEVDRCVIVRGRFEARKNPMRKVDQRGRRPVARGWQLAARAVTDVFIDPDGSLAEGLLDQAACRGLSHGGARVSDDSANSIRSTRTCTSADVLTLVRRMRSRVWRRMGVELETRVVFIDERGARVKP